MPQRILKEALSLNAQGGVVKPDDPTATQVLGGQGSVVSDEDVAKYGLGKEHLTTQEELVKAAPTVKCPNCGAEVSVLTIHKAAWGEAPDRVNCTECGRLVDVPAKAEPAAKPEPEEVKPKKK